MTQTHLQQQNNVFCFHFLILKVSTKNGKKNKNFRSTKELATNFSLLVGFRENALNALNRHTCWAV